MVINLYKNRRSSILTRLIAPFFTKHNIKFILVQKKNENFRQASEVLVTLINLTYYYGGKVKAMV